MAAAMGTGRFGWDKAALCFARLASPVAGGTTETGRGSSTLLWWAHEYEAYILRSYSTGP